MIGKGWQMAKHLSAGDRLPGARFTSILEKVEQGSELEAYNLIVGDFRIAAKFRWDFCGNSGLWRKAGTKWTV